MNLSEKKLKTVLKKSYFYPARILDFSAEEKSTLGLKDSYLLPECRMKNKSEVWLMSDGSVFESWKLDLDSLRDPEGMKGVYDWKKKSKFFFYKKVKLPEIQGPWFTVLDHWSHEYYHWFLDALPRIYWILKSCPKPPGLILAERYQTPYVKWCLEQLDLDVVVYLRRKEKAFVENLILPGFCSSFEAHRPRLARGLQSIFPSSPSCLKKIYISREKARYRKIKNESELKTLLEQYGYQIVIAEDLSFDDQIKIFSQTKVLIGLHGAGLTNMLFMRPEGQVIELRKEEISRNKAGFQKNAFENTYLNLALALNHKYDYILGKGEDGSESATTADISIDLESVEKKISFT